MYFISMAIFISTFKGSVDAKNRVVVPKDFRLVLENQSSFVAFRSHKFSAIDCFTMQKIEQLSEKIEQDYDGFSLDRDSLESAIFADAVILKFDKDGRVVIPEFLTQHANIESEVSFVGKGSTFQIWNPELFKSHQEIARKKLFEKK